MIHPIQMQKQLIGVGFDPATIFGTPVREDPEEAHALGIVERQDPVIEKVGGGQGRFVRIHLGETDVGMNIDAGLLVDFAHALDVSDITGVLPKEESRMRALDLAVGLLFLFGFLQGLDLRFREDALILGGPFFQPF